MGMTHDRYRYRRTFATWRSSSCSNRERVGRPPSLASLNPRNRINAPPSGHRRTPNNTRCRNAARRAVAPGRQATRPVPRAR